LAIGLDIVEAVDNVLYGRGLTKLKVGTESMSTEEMLKVTGLDAELAGILYECSVCGWPGLTDNELKGVRTSKPHLFCVNCRLQKEIVAHSGGQLEPYYRGQLEP
jgi:hypothetical protein